jgi:hypothetical protein
MGLANLKVCCGAEEMELQRRQLAKSFTTSAAIGVARQW